MARPPDTDGGLTAYLDALVGEITAGRQPPATSVAKLGRRDFIKLSGLAGGGLVLGFSLKTPTARATTGKNELVFNAYLQITPAGDIVIMAPNPEIGQGVKTALPMIVAEELDVRWNDVRVMQSPIDADAFGRQFAGGSRSIPDNWQILRRAGASARAMLVAAAAARWGKSAGELETMDSRVIHRTSGQSAGYGELAEAAARQSPPDNVRLKDRKDFRLLGRRIPGVDNRAIVTGQALFGIDQSPNNLSYAVYHKCPSVGGKVVSANLDHIKTLNGIQDAFILEGNGNPGELKPGIAIVADSTWAALKARDALQVQWDTSTAAADDWDALAARAAELSSKPPQQIVTERGDVAQAVRDPSNKARESYYTHHFVAHAPMEPQNAAAWHSDGRIEIWSGTQTPGRAISAVAALLGIDSKNVHLHQLRAGGGFGRRLINDPVCEAAAIAQRIGGSVKLQWTREDDMANDFFRVGGFHAMKGAVNSAGELVAFEDHLITFSENGTDPVSGGALRPAGYPENACANSRLAHSMLPLGIQCGPWRAPGSNTTAWAQQSFLGELAAAAGRDQLEFLIETLQSITSPVPGGVDKNRAIATVKLAASRAGWGRNEGKGRGMGVAFYYSHMGHVAQVADISVDASKRLTVHKVTVAADVGPIVNLSGAEAMIQGAVVDALSTMAGQAIGFKSGVISPLNFDQYPLLRIRHTPEVEVHFIESDNEPTGLGEPGLPPLAPAVGNAIFAASGIRPRTLPLSREGYVLA
ncbi:MAG: isoquinoline 1-oxidoreductase [Porticoccaceae bacterium]|nr:isoquinoline 1-oxidoreductase [Porticoccaceae bacterium]